MHDYAIAILFWLVYEVLTWPLRLALVPVGMRADLSRMISRVAGPPSIALVAWVAAHFGLRLGLASIWFWFAIFLIGGTLIFKAQGSRVNLRTALSVVSPVPIRRRWRQDLMLELIGLALFFSFLAFRRYAPEMTTPAMNANIGAEKFTNAMIFWSTWHATSLPPDDYWLSGTPHAYYYWGQYFWAWVGRAGGFPGEWVITLALARLVALIWEASYLLVRSFGARPLSAALGAFFVTWGGNPEAVRQVYLQYNYASGRSAEREEDRDFPFASRYIERWRQADWNAAGYRFWEPSRVFRGTINEFPAWTAILGDFHAHHISIPWLIAWLAVALRGDHWFRLRRDPRSKPRKNPKVGDPGIGDEKGLFLRAALWVWVFVVLGVIAALANLWIAPLIGLGSFVIFVWRLRRGLSGYALRLLAVGSLGLTMLGAVALSRGGLSLPLPSAGSVQGSEPSFIEKVPVKLLPEDIRSTRGELFWAWGFHVGLLLVAVGMAAWRGGLTWAKGGWLAASALAILLFTFALPGQPILVWTGILCAVATLGLGKKPWLQPPVTVFLCGACFLLGGLEVFYIQQRYTGELIRYDSYFKFSYAAWPLLTAAAWMSVQRLWRLSGPRPVRYGLRAALLPLAPLVMAMAIFGAPARNLQADADVPLNLRVERKPTLDAFAWLETRRGYEAEAQMLAWIRENVPPGDRVAEAAFATAYSYNGRVASLAGRPVPLGWDHHERQWRGDEAAEQAIRLNTQRTRRLYDARDAQAVRRAARELGVRWVVFGKNEIEHYGIERSVAIIQALTQAGDRRGFPPPPERPQVFIFEIKDSAEER